MQSKNTTIGKLSIKYDVMGHGEPLIIIHGGSSSSGAWRENALKLSTDYKVYIPDLPGFGQSQPYEGNYHIPELVDFINDFAHDMDLDNFHLIGHSLGGSVVINYVLRFPEKVKKLVLVSSMSLGREIAWWIKLLSHKVLAEPITKLTRIISTAVRWVISKAFSRPPLTNLFSTSTIAIGSSMFTIKEQAMILLDRLSEIKIPTLIVWGADDPIVPASHAYQAAQLIPQCEVKVYPGCGHIVYKQKIHEFSQLLLGFFHK